MALEEKQNFDLVGLFIAVIFAVSNTRKWRSRNNS